MEERNYSEELLEILNSSLSDEEKKQKILSYHESDIADVVDLLEESDRKEIFRILGDDASGDVLIHTDDISDVIDDLDPDKAADIIESMDADDAIDVLDELDEDQKQKIIPLMDKEATDDIKEIIKYDEDMIGSKMTNNYVVISKDDTVKSATKKVINQAADNDNISTIFVVNSDNTFYGVLELRELIIARPDTELSLIIKTNYPYFNAHTEVSEIINDLKEYGLNSYPIVDDNNMIVGAITSDDVIEALDDESGDDYVKLAGITEEEDLDESVRVSVKKRIPWLIVLLVLDLIQSFTMSGFEAVVAALPIITFFQTLVLDMAGNSGTQSLAVTIRLLSTQDVDKKAVGKAIWKEIRVGFLNGVILAILSTTFVLIFLFISKRPVKADTFVMAEAVKASIIVGVSLFSAMTVSSLIGTIMPVFFKKIHIDPAVASGPFITTINDITALLIYYGLVMILFNIAL